MPTAFRSQQQAAIELLSAAHAICDEYEQDCGDGETPLMRPYLDRAPASVRTWVLTELLASVSERKQAAGAELDPAALRAIAGVSQEEFDAAWPADSRAAPTAVAAGDLTQRFVGSPALSDVVLAVDPSSPTRRFDSATAAGAPNADAVKSSTGEAPFALDDYLIENKLGAGGMGVVYRAYQHSLRRYVALKIIKEEYLGAPQAVARFLLEAEAAGRLDHPNIVPVFDFGQRDNIHYFAMALVEGGNLKDYVGPDAPRLPVRRVAEVIECIARAVQHAHDRGVIHRDIKPGNILLDKAGEPKLADFGVAKVHTAGDHGQTALTGLTGTNQPLGTAAYMAPEQAFPKGRAISPQTDVYALGATLYSLLAGCPPFQGTDFEILQQVIKNNPPPLRQLAPDVPVELQTICERSMAKLPQDRIQSAEELADDLRRYLDGAAICAQPVGAWERLSRWCGRNPLLASLIGTAALAMIVGSIVSTAFGIRATHEAARANAALDAGQSLIEETFLVASEDLKDDPGTQTVREDLLKRAQQYYEDLARTSADDPALRRDFAEAQFMLGQAQLELGRRAEARDILEQAVAVQEEVAAQPAAGAEALAAVAFTHQALGKLFSLESAEAKRKKVEADKRAASADQALAVAAFTHQALGKLFSLEFANANAKFEAVQRAANFDRLTDAWGHHAKLAADYRRRVAALKSNELDALRQWASSLESLASAHIESASIGSDTAAWSQPFEEFEEAQQLRERAIAASADEVAQMMVRRDLARGFGNLAKSRLFYVLALPKRDRSAANAQSENAAREANKANAQIESAVSEFSKAIALYQQLRTWLSLGGRLERTSTSDVMYEQANCQLLLGNAMRALRRMDAARDQYSQSIRTMKLVCVRNPQVRLYRGVLRTSLERLSEIELATGNLEASEPLIHELLSTHIDAIEADPHSHELATEYVEAAAALLQRPRVVAAGREFQASLAETAAGRLRGLLDQSPDEYGWLAPAVERLQTLAEEMKLEPGDGESRAQPPAAE